MAEQRCKAGQGKWGRVKSKGNRCFLPWVEAAFQPEQGSMHSRHVRAGNNLFLYSSSFNCCWYWGKVGVGITGTKGDKPSQVLSDPSLCADGGVHETKKAHCQKMWINCRCLETVLAAPQTAAMG